MLFRGEAIFGVIDLLQDSRNSSNRAQAMIDAARKQGGRVCCKTAGSGTFGWMGSAAPSATYSPITTDASCLAVSVGELYERGEREALYYSEPQRSAFVTRRFAAEGAAFLRRLDGVFASAIWNESAQELFVSCDWRGDGRIFYTVEEGRFSFSSWLPLLASPAPAFDPVAIGEFLRFLYIAAPRTIYRGIARLEGGRYLKLSRGHVQLEPLEPAAAAVSENRSGPDLTEFQDHFETAIRRRVDRRRVGILLSGGVDSAALAAGCERVNPGSVEAFTVGFDNVELDETLAARALANQIGVPHRPLCFDLAAYAGAFERVAHDLEQPFGDPVQLPLALACESAKERVDVLCDGTGSDGLFGAPMPRHLKFSATLARFVPAPWRHRIAAALRRPGASALSERASLFEFDDVEELFITWSGWSRRELGELLGAGVDFCDSGFYRVFHAQADASAQQLYDAIGVFPPDDSRFDCAAVARAPLELPNHDVALWSYVRSLPENCRSADGGTKVILRRLFARYYPAAGAANKKHYFNMPLDELMARSNYALVNEYLARTNLARHGLVDPVRAWRWISRYTAGERSLRFKIWALIVLHAWLDARSAER